MVSSLTQTIIAILLVPFIPLLIYIIGILIPESHVVSRTAVYKIRPERLWQLLTNVEEYPLWRPKLESVSIDSITPATQDEGKRVVFVEHSKRNRRSVILHVEQQPMKTMLRVLEERITTTVSLKSPVPTRPHVPTFSGSWTFELKYPPNNQKLILPPNNNETPTVQLKITEQGVIKKPLVRLSNMLLFGYYRRIDRFIKDLEKRVEQDHHNDNTNTTTTIVGDQNEKLHHSSQKRSADNNVNVEDQQINKSSSSTHLEKDNENFIHNDYCPSLGNNSSSSVNSKNVEKDWDLVSEIYERQKA
ncbi:hypothetical protein BJ944DRAFT_259911 [Cunninghamella echinulata]|nr:hypothetical protein BJ944DRAFT_259911 [Cunninghamella echinulata]